MRPGESHLHNCFRMAGELTERKLPSMTARRPVSWRTLQVPRGTRHGNGSPRNPAGRAAHSIRVKHEPRIHLRS